MKKPNVLGGDAGRHERRLGRLRDERPRPPARRFRVEVLGRGVAAARDAGVPIAEVARLAGISRQAVYDILRKRSSQK